MSDPLDELLRRGDPAKNARPLDSDLRLERVFVRPAARRSTVFRRAILMAAPLLALGIAFATIRPAPNSERVVVSERQARLITPSPPPIRVVSAPRRALAPFVANPKRPRRRIRSARVARQEPRRAVARRTHRRRRAVERVERVSPDTIERIVIDHEATPQDSGPIVAVTIFGSGENLNTISTSPKEPTL